ncbi:ABC transporter permease [Niabella sp. CC-SYL272]|uniref:ABC transporter permease n=1 Tax=Niabella agricola TaxID=2891571 RepID=UPI001F27A95A|nr:ABC transporter permease [Niabella agricola]MCF3107464.1 ABC transporter permease [Niabella agricola]
MFKNYFKTAWRSLWANKFYSLLNVSGLAVGLAAGILLLIWVQHEFGYDKFHSRSQNIYRINVEIPSADKPLFWSATPGSLAVIAKKIPEVQSLVRISGAGQVLSDESNKKILTGNVLACVDSNFFSVFDFGILKGNLQTVLPGVQSIALTRSTAQKLFGTEDALGKTVRHHETDFTVSAILKDVPENSTLRFDALFPMALYAQNFTRNGGNGSWKTIDEDMGNYSFESYVLLHPNAHIPHVEQAFTGLYQQARNDDNKSKFHLQRLQDLHLVGNDGSTAALLIVQVIFAVALLLLVIASINYVNLSTARALTRVKEVSVRKIVGAGRIQLFFQFVTETILLFCLALMLAAGLIVLLMPLYNTIAGKELVFHPGDDGIWKAVGLAGLITLVLSSIYPALLLSSFKPVRSLKGALPSGIGIAALRKGLVVFQFFVSIVLLIGTVAMGRQMQYIKDKNLGFDKSYVFTADFPTNDAKHLDAIKTELGKEPAILSVGNSSEPDIMNVTSGSGDLEWKGKTPDMQLMISEVATEKNFLPTLKLPFVEGGDFSGTPADSNKYIVNETAVKQMGLKPPYVGQPLTSHGRQGLITGVLKDFNFQPLTKAIGPILFHTFWKGNIFYIRTTGNGAQAAIQAVEREYKKYADGLPFHYEFLDKKFDAQYRAEQRTGMLFNVFAGIAIFISCLGLFGLATYTAQRKVKEIGIRKVLGASVPGIVGLISTGFLKLILVAVVLAMPVAYIGTHRWLQNFAYHASLPWFLFALAAVFVLLIAFATMCLQAVRAAMANPVNALRSE